MKARAIILLATTLLVAAGAPADDPPPRRVFVPYKDLAAAIDPAAKTVLMDREEFARLLAAAEANALGAEGLELGQVAAASYAASVEGKTLALTGELTVVSLSDKPVAVPLEFALVGLTAITLDGKPAPLGYDSRGRLAVILSRRGEHKMTLAASTVVADLPGGGMQFGLSLPPAVAASMKLTAPGDLDVHATVPVGKGVYDAQADRTTADFTLGGQGALTVVLTGNGRQEDQRAILLGESAATVDLTRSHQVLSCLYTMQILRRGVRELTFRLPKGWTVTEVACPNLVRWSVPPEGPDGGQNLVVRLRKPERGTQTVHIRAIAPREGDQWAAPRLALADAAFQRGFLLVEPGDELRIRSETLGGSRRESPEAAKAASGLFATTAGRLYYHWGEDWSVRLDLATVALQRTCGDRQFVMISPEQITLDGRFQVAAVGREMFDMSFLLPEEPLRWDVDSVTVNGSREGFEYRVATVDGKRTLRIELAGAVMPEAVAVVNIVLRHVPSGWDFTPPMQAQSNRAAGAGKDAQAASEAPSREVSVPLIRAVADTVSGLVAVVPGGDLDSTALTAPPPLKVVNVGRMASLGLGQAVQAAWTYEGTVDRPLRLSVTRRPTRLTADAVGVASASAGKLSGAWRLTYHVTRAATRTLHLIADASLGETLKIEGAGHLISSRKRTAAAPDVPAGYDLWTLTLDGEAVGDVVVLVEYQRPTQDGKFAVPLVRPFNVSQAEETLAVQAGEEIAVDLAVSDAGEIDAIDLPPLPAPVSRILAAYSLRPLPEGRPSVTLAATVHKTYGIPSAVVTEASLETYLGADGSQRTAATFRLVNSGMQFLHFRLPAGAELWSVRVGDQQAKPRQDADGSCLVSVPRSREPLPVRIVYSWKAPSGADVKLGGVSLPGLDINKADWTVTPPPGQTITGQQTNMQTEDILAPRPAWEACWDVIGAIGTLRHFGTLGIGQKLKSTTPSSEIAEDGTPVKDEEGREHDARRSEEEDRSKREPEPALAEKPAAPLLTKVPAPTRLAGRYTLPVELVPVVGAGPRATFTCLGEPALTVTLAENSRFDTWQVLGLLLVVGLGLAKVNARAAWKCKYIVGALLSTGLLAGVWPAAVPFANGGFAAALYLIVGYPAIGLARFILRPIAWALGRRLAVAALILAAVATSAAPSFAGAPADESKPAPPPPAPPVVVIPYEGDPAQADKAGKVLLPYARFAELWNRAHPEDPIDVSPRASTLSLADVRYAASLEGKELRMELTAQVAVAGKGEVTLPMPISGLAVQDATLDDKPASLRVGPGGMVLTVPGETAGLLRVRMVATPTIQGRRGSVAFTLPPLPAAVLTLTLPESDLLLETPGLEAALTSRTEGAGVAWIVPLGATRKLTLQWLPKAGGGTADRTLAAVAAHDVQAHHWSLVGASRMVYTFSADYDRFTLLLPDELTLTDLTGANLRDHRVVETRRVDGGAFKVIEVRLYRPASKQYELTARWLAPLPKLDAPAPLPLPRAGDVGRESGTVRLHAAGGMTLKVPEVVGGRRSSLAAADKAGSASAAVPVAEYYWPYRPFAITIQLSRETVQPKIVLNQLVRVTSEHVQLLSQAVLTARTGRLFGASFALPDGYELLSAVGAEVGDFYVQPTPTGRRLHVNLRSAAASTSIALVLVRNAAVLDPLSVPTVTAVTPEGEPLPNQTGRLAVQVADALSAHTASSENLRAAPPRQVARDWLDDAQIHAVQFAYEYETPKISLQLTVAPKPSKVRVEVLGGLVVSPAAASYAYRLRYEISGSPIDQVTFSLPSEFAPLVAVVSLVLRSVKKDERSDGRTQWTVSLVNEVTGLLDVTVNFSLPVDASTTALPLPTLLTDAPAGYRTVLAVQNFSRHELALGDGVKLVPLPVEEQRKILPDSSRQSLQYALQSFEPDWSAGFKVTAAREAKRVQAVVDLLALTTVVDADGRCRYEVLVTLQNRSEQFLRVRVPAGVSLWSAYVADQPVKPVTDSASAGEVLIPLVKTSPGGLPYDVRMYLAGEGLTPLGTVTKLSPPAVNVVGVPVTRTTWTLRLPGGYRYVRPGGNVAPVAGTAELMTIALEARLDQFERLKWAYSDRISSGKFGDYERENWKDFNKRLAYQIHETGRNLDVEQQRGNISAGQYAQFQGKIQDISAGQYGGNTELDTTIQRQSDLYAGNLIAVVNNDAPNGGLDEWDRNGALNELPAYVVQAADLQKKNIAKEQSEIAQEIANVGTDIRELPPGRSSDKGKKTSADEKADKPATGEELNEKLVHDDADKEAQTREVLQKLAEEQKTRIVKQQAQGQQQLAQLEDNRLGRFYNRRSLDQQAANQPAPQQSESGMQVGHANSYRQSGGRVALADGQVVDQLGSVVVTNGSTSARQPASGTRGGGAGATTPRGDARPGVPQEPPVAGPVPTTPGEPAGPTGGEVGGVADGGWGYVAAGMFSLPVELPAGQVELSFARPGGEPEVTVWAVRSSAIDAAERTAGVLFFLLTALLAGRLCRAWSGRGKFWLVSLAASYVLMAIILAVLGGAFAACLAAAFLAAGLAVWRRRIPAART